jgi:hypothetical protein
MGAVRAHTQQRNRRIVTSAYRPGATLIWSDQTVAPRCVRSGLKMAPELTERNVGCDVGTKRSHCAHREFFRLWQILLQKSFCGGERKFFEPLMRSARTDRRDHIFSSKIDHGPP